MVHSNLLASVPVQDIEGKAIKNLKKGGGTWSVSKR
jgi:hypothetical protein